uniref:C-type lectin domain-containing protein n=1 Tax=Stegastes partitus TaxID=144197 RepID=A0A3B5A5C3_9TELE
SKKRVFKLYLTLSCASQTQIAWDFPQPMFTHSCFGFSYNAPDGRKTALTWSDAQHSCSDLAAGSHLADLKTLEDLLFMSSYLLTHDNLLLLWTGLNDQQKTYLKNPHL